jgi:hypothetical protein
MVASRSLSNGIKPRLHVNAFSIFSLFLLLIASNATTLYAQAALTTPVPSTQLPGTSVTFKWTPGASTHFELWLGTLGPGTTNLYDSGSVTATTETVGGLPSNGQTVYARLYWLINGAWQYADYTYKAHGSATQGVLSTPTPGARLSGTTVTFTWTPGNTATRFEFWLGTSAGSSNLYNSGNVTATTETVTGLPGNGEKIYARLYSLIDGAWQYTNYTYVASTAPNVYVVGTAYNGTNYVPAYWENGVATVLPTPTGMTSASANGIAVSGSDVYVVGTAPYGVTETGYTEAVYWLNGVATVLPSPTGMTGGGAYAIAVSGGNVYIAGFASNNTTVVAAYWLNGVATALPTPIGMPDAYARAIAISGGDVYLAGYADNNANYVPEAVLWENGVATVLSKPTGTTSASSNAVAVSGSDVYVAGAAATSTTGEAVIWLNGTATTLPNPTGTTGDDGVALAISGNDVYVAGYGYNNSVHTSTLWENGVATALPKPTGMTSANGLAVAVSGNDVYVAGDAYNNATSVAAYWENGAVTALPLPGGTTAAYGYAVAVAAP